MENTPERTKFVHDENKILILLLGGGSVINVIRNYYYKNVENFIKLAKDSFTSMRTVWIFHFDSMVYTQPREDIHKNKKKIQKKIIIFSHLINFNAIR